MNESMLATLSLGFMLGLKHATEADHLAAVSTIVSERRSIIRSATVGVLWGVGHTAALIIAGILVLSLGLVIPERVANLLELAVAVMIIFLGARLLHMHIHVHAHGKKKHLHLHFQGEQHDARGHGGLAGWRPVIVGVVHGLAGSAALTVLVLSEVVQYGGVGLGFAYILVFGLGSIAGMLLMSIVIGLPFSYGTKFVRQTYVPLQLLTAIFSTGFGVFYALKTLDKLAIF
jgi:sulfite exporter TauE/SafE